MDETSSKSKSAKKWKGSSRKENTQMSKRVKGELIFSLAIWHVQQLSDNHPGANSRVLMSRFAQDDGGSVNRPIVASSADPIHFQQTICTISTDNGQYSFTESSTVETGLLDQNTMFLSIADRGKTKDVYGASCISFFCKVTG